MYTTKTQSIEKTIGNSTSQKAEQHHHKKSISNSQVNLDTNFLKVSLDKIYKQPKVTKNKAFTDPNFNNSLSLF